MHSDTTFTRWIFLDLDDTLWDFSANSAAALDYIYRNHPVLSTIVPEKDLFISRYIFHNDRLWNDYHHARISSEFLKAERFKAVIREFTSDPDALKIGVELNSFYLDTLAEGSELVDGARNLLESLSSKYLIGIISNGFLNVQYKKLFGTGLDRYVQRMVISDEIGINKPSREIFDYALSETGADPERAIMIGDNPDTDIAGAVNAGWKAIFFNRKGKAIPEGIDLSRIRVADTLDIIPGLVSQLDPD